MIVDIMASLLFFCIGVLIGNNYHAIVKNYQTMKPKKRHATRNPHSFLHGKHKMEWFWRREAETDPDIRRLSLRDYAKLQSRL